MGLPNHKQELELKFSRVALFTGRPMYWTVVPVSVTARQHAEGVVNLLRWCFGLPGARLGIDPQGIGLIVRSIYARRRKAPDVQVDRWLDRVGAVEREVIPWPYDVEEFGPHLCQLLRYVREAQKTRGSYVWMDASEASWWLEKTANSLLQYANLFRSGESESPLLRLFARHRCTVFAPLNGPALWDHLMTLLNGLPVERRRRFRNMLSYHGLRGGEDLESSPQPYWSWRLIDFAVSRNDLVYTPMLTLWSSWPSNRRWAPGPPADEPLPVPLSPSEAASLLEDVLWKKIETLFAVARMACGLGVAEPEFAGREARPPVFYFLLPTDSPRRPEDYVEKHRQFLHTVARKCLGTDDPLSQEVGWGILEGDLVALRRERVTRSAVRSWYLLLPVSTKPATPEELETDLEFVARSLTYLEFSIGHNARDVDTDLDVLSTPQALWGGTLDAMSTYIGEAIGLLDLLNRPNRERIYREIASLQLVLRHLQSRMERIFSDAYQLQRKFQGYVDGTEDFIRRQITFSPFSHPFTFSLRDALMDAYPYHYLLQPLQGLENVTESLSVNIASTINTVKTTLEEAERLRRENQERWARWVNVMVGLLALLIALPQFIPGSVLTQKSYPAWLSRYLPLEGLEATARALVGIAVMALAVMAVYFFTWSLYGRFPHTEPFIRKVQRLWQLVDLAQTYALARRVGAAEEVTAFLRQVEGRVGPEERQLLEDLLNVPGETDYRIGEEIERMDDEATQLLADLWDTLRGEGQASRWKKMFRRLLGGLQKLSSPAEMSDWLQKTQRLRYLIYLFDLCPDTIPLPRTLCIFRYKSTDFHDRTMVAGWAFQRSLMLVGFESEEVWRLDEWLSSLHNRARIQQMDVCEFAEALKSWGVTADSRKRKPDEWRGPIENKVVRR